AATPEFAAYSHQTIANAKEFAGALSNLGYRVVSGGTDTHVLLVDVFAKGIRGKDAQAALESAHITANRNAIPFDQNPPFNPSGMGFGSPAVTTRGFREPEMRETATLVAQVLGNLLNEANLADVRTKVKSLTDRFPLYSWKRLPG